jgi:hypothetical protein
MILPRWLDTELVREIAKFMKQKPIRAMVVAVVVVDTPDSGQQPVAVEEVEGKTGAEIETMVMIKPEFYLIVWMRRI